MSTTAPGMAADDEPYTGPPPTRRPEPGQVVAPPWQPAPWPPAPWPPAPWPPVPWPPPPGAWGYGPPAPVPPWVPPGAPPHDVPQPYLHAMRSRTWAAWRPAVGLLLLVVVYVVVAILAFVLGIVGLILAGGASFAESDLEGLSGPGVVLLTNLVTAVAIPVVWLAWAAAHGMRIGWSSSVLGHLRWRLFPWYTFIALATLGAGICLSLVLALTRGWESGGGPVASYGWLLVVVFLTTPLQAAAEEYLFRGYLSQAVAGWLRTPEAGAVLAALVTGTLFSLAHLPADLPSFLYYFVVGLGASAVVWLTGGLEAAIALHTVNNVVIFVVAGALGEDVMASAESGASLAWFDVGLTLLALGVFVALVARSRARLRPETTTPALDLRPPAHPAGELRVWSSPAPARHHPWGMG